jgi:ABC-type lipoprotein release transport system permease subunit
MAWRNVWRNTRRSVVTIAAMTLSLWVLILYSGLIEGYIQGMERDIVELEIGDLQITTEAYRDDPSLFERIEDPDTIVAALEAQGMHASPRLLGGGLGAAGEQSAALSLRGVDPVKEAATLGIDTHLMRGTWLSADDPKGVVIGRRLAKGLSADLGSELVVLSQGADGSMANDLFHVVGVLAPVSDGTDRTGVFLTDTAFREMMVVDGGAHQIIASRPEGMALAEAGELARSAAPGLLARTWAEMMPEMAQMLETSRAAIVFVFLIVYLAVAILILNAVLMAVFERVREFGVMKAIGVPPSSVLAMILLETAIQAAVATVAATLLALPGIWYLTEHGLDMSMVGGTSVMGMAMRQIWYGIFTPVSLGLPIGMLWFLSLIAALYPAIRAATLAPLDAMRHT